MTVTPGEPSLCAACLPGLALAGRGALFLNLPAGFEKVDRHSIAKTPDQHERDAIDMVFRKFRELRSIRQVHLWFRRRGMRNPVRDLKGIAWRVPHDSTLASMLRHPIYAGACVYGRRRQEVTVDASGTKKVRGGIMKPEDEWSVLLRDRHEGYIGWDEYERNRRVIEANTVGNRGAPRTGKALLAGLLSCGRCGLRLQVVNNGKSHRYQCPGDVRTGGKTCIGFGGVRAARRRCVGPDQARRIGAGGGPLQGRARAGAFRRGRSRQQQHLPQPGGALGGMPGRGLRARGAASGVRGGPRGAAGGRRRPRRLAGAGRRPGACMVA